MKKIYFTVAAFILLKTASAQILLEDKDGEKVVNYSAVLTPDISRLSLIKLNTGDQSLGFGYFISSALHDPAKYIINEFGLKAAPTAGYAAVFRNGQFSPGIKANYGLTLVNPFNRSTLTKTVDWATLDAIYSFDQYSLYQPNTTFASQIYSRAAHSFRVNLSYNTLLASRFILNLKAGYARQNNYANLSQVDVTDITATTNANTTRQITSTTTAAQGNFTEYNAFPQVLSFTRATKTDAEGSADAARLRIGYTLFIKNQFSSYLDKTDAGAIIFLSRQDKSGIRNPVLGLVLQAVNLFDTQQLNNGLQNRIRIGFTSNFSL